MRWIFYDLETSGLSVAFDQILQYAAITTDADFNIINSDTGYAQYRPDVWPAPEAAVTHCINSIPAHAPTESAVIKKLHQEFNTPNTITLGYNTLGFDDEFLRFAFYRNLLPPYTHQYANNCQRRDLYPITALYYLFAHDALNWPTLDGKISLKLEALNAANNLATGEAHDALVDVNVTIALAQRLKGYDAKMWQFANLQFDKQHDAHRISQLNAHANYSAHKIALLVSGRFAAKNNFIRPAILLGGHKHYRNQTVWLALDNDLLHKATPDNFLEYCHIINRKPCEQIFVLPFTDNYAEKLTPAANKNLARNIAWLNGQNSCTDAISEYARNYTYPKIDNIDAYAELYQCGFADMNSNKLMRQFQLADLDNKIKIQRQLPTPYNELARRLILLNEIDAEHELQAEKNAYIDFSSNARIDNRGQQSHDKKQLLQRADNLTNLSQAQSLALQFCKEKLSADLII